MTGLVLLAVLLGAGFQRVTGMGFGLIAAPLLVSLLGPAGGVMVVNVCAALTAATILLRVTGSIDWPRYRVLALAAAIGIAPAALMVKYIPPPVLEVGIGLLLAVGLTASLISAALPSRRRYLWVTGAVSGFMSTAAGVGGPAIVVYSRATQWKHRGFAATVQPYFFTIACLALVAKTIANPGFFPELAWTTWLMAIAACLIGITIGETLVNVVPARTAQTLVIALAYVGATATVTRGTIAWIQR